MAIYDDLNKRSIGMNAQMQNDLYRNQGLGAMFNQRVNPLDGCDIKSIPLEELSIMIEVLVKEYDRRTMHTPMQGPTRHELESNEALKNAWDAYQVIKKLQGK
jgi:hypothetical protein